LEKKFHFEFMISLTFYLLYCTVFLYNKGVFMTIEYTYTSAREKLAALLDRVTQDREVVIIHRRSGEDVAMISADELASLTESAYLLRAPENAERLLSALSRALKNEGQPQTIEALRGEVGLDAKA
jgi:antitoxin YefM